MTYKLKTTTVNPSELKEFSQLLSKSQIIVLLYIKMIDTENKTFHNVKYQRQAIVDILGLEDTCVASAIRELYKKGFLVRVFWNEYRAK